MDRIIQRINERISVTPEEFASSFNRPDLANWIKKQFNNGYLSKDKYYKIINWHDETDSVLSNYDFAKAFHKAQEYENNRKIDFEFDDLENKKYVSKDFVLEKDGNKWIRIGTDDIKLASINLNFDLTPFSDYEVFILVDDQDRTVVALIKINKRYKLIGHSNGSVTPYSEMVKRLCIKLGLDLTPDSMTNSELVEAIKSGQINLSKINGLEKTLNRLSAEQIIDCELLAYSTNLQLATVYKLYKMTRIPCLLKYCTCSLIYHGLKQTSLYNLCRQEMMKFPEYIAEINKSKNDTDIYDLMSTQAKEIMAL